MGSRPLTTLVLAPTQIVVVSIPPAIRFGFTPRRDDRVMR